jgi:hypothetical protein
MSKLATAPDRHTARNRLLRVATTIARVIAVAVLTLYIVALLISAVAALSQPSSWSY